MRTIRSAFIVAAAFCALAILNSAVLASARTASGAQEALSQKIPTGSLPVTRIQTITLVASDDPFATNLTTIWDSSWTNIPRNSFFIPLPADFNTVTVGGDYHIATNLNPPIVTGFGEVFTNRIDLTPTAALTLFLSYHTDSRAIRVGNQYRLVIHATLPEGGFYQSNVIFNDDDYEFVSYDYDAPDTLYQTLGGPLTQTLGGNQTKVGWGPVEMVPSDRFDRNIVLGDSRLVVDLAPESFGVQTLLARPQGLQNVQITATIVNSGTVQTGSFLVVELYDKPAGSGPPNDPEDHRGGVCIASTQCALSKWRNHYWYYIPGLQSGQKTPIMFNHIFAEGGPRDLYLQVDSFGGSFGYNYEPGAEGNNIQFLGTFNAADLTFLSSILK